MTLAASAEIRNPVFIDEKNIRKPQGLIHDKIWERFLTEPELQDDELDQHVLKIIDSQEIDALVDAIRDQNRTHEVERFERMLEPNTLLQLVDSLVSQHYRLHRTMKGELEWKLSSIYSGGVAGVVGVAVTGRPTYSIRHSIPAPLLNSVATPADGIR